MNRKLILILFGLSIILIITGGLLIFTVHSNTKTSFEKTADEYIENLTDEIINGTNKKNLIQLLRVESISNGEIMTGKDMYLVGEFTDEQLSMYNLSEYVKKGEDLRAKLEKQIQDNFSYNIKSTKEESNNTVVTISYKTFNYISYIDDLGALQGQILSMAGYDINNLDDSYEVLADVYKAKIKSASILNSYLDSYGNNEKLETTIEFINNSIDDSSEDFLNYFNSLKGSKYEQVRLTENSEYLNKMLSEIDASNPLAI